MLDESTRAKAVFAFDDAIQRKRWSNLPTGIFQRVGLRLGDLTPAQRSAAMAFLAIALSPSGYLKVVAFMEGVEQLTKGGGPGGKIVFGRDEYYLSFLGTPSVSSPWLIQFGGHHLALNITLVGDQGALTPSHTAAQPSKFTFEGKTVRPLGEENDQAFALVNALDATQQKQAILGAQFRDLVLGPGQEGKMIMPEGVKASTFNAKQRTQLLAFPPGDEGRHGNDTIEAECSAPSPSTRPPSSSVFQPSSNRPERLPGQCPGSVRHFCRN